MRELGAAAGDEENVVSVSNKAKPELIEVPTPAAGLPLPLAGA